jgi:glycosyltransferase involved in cell wall biosynthesis
MRILLLSQVVPSPPDSGPRVKTGHVIRYLATRGHEVTLAAFARREERAHLPALTKSCIAVHSVPIQRSRRRDLAAWLRSHRTGRPFLVERDDDAAMRALARRLLASGQFDAVHADQLSMTQFVHGAFRSPAAASGLLSVFDAHNAVWRLTDRLSDVTPSYFRPALALETRRLHRYEGEVVRRFHRTLAVTEADRDALRAAALAGEPSSRDGSTGVTDDRITVVPIGVDTAALQPVPRTAASTEILTLGALHYRPNLDGIRWFAREVLPRARRDVATATLTIVGPRPARDLVALARRQPGVVRVTGHVPDVTPYFARAGVVVVPVRVGAGMRVRILEAFARAVPVVTTTVGLEGIEAEPGRDVLVADTSEALAAAVARVLRDPALATALATRGRRLVEARYDWRVSLKGLDRVYAPPRPRHLGRVP